MSDNSDAEVKKALKYIQIKERRIAALSNAMGRENVGIYREELNNILTLVVEDKLPGSIDTVKLFPDLYPKPEEKKKEQSDE